MRPICCPQTKHLYFILQGNKTVFPSFCFRVQLLKYRFSKKALSLFIVDILPPLVTIQLFLVPCIFLCEEKQPLNSPSKGISNWCFILGSFSVGLLKNNRQVDTECAIWGVGTPATLFNVKIEVMQMLNQQLASLFWLWTQWKLTQARNHYLLFPVLKTASTEEKASKGGTGMLSLQANLARLHCSKLLMGARPEPAVIRQKKQLFKKQPGISNGVL